MILFIFVFHVFVASQPDNTEALLGTVYFDTDDTALTQDSKMHLNAIADTLQAAPNLLIDVCGYAKNSSSANMTISQEMADRVNDYLVTNLGIVSDRIRALVLGAQNRIATNHTDKNNMNRYRVDIVVRQPDAILTWFENDVKVQPPTLRPLWLEPVPNYYLYHGYKVATGERSSAHILYPNKGTLTLEEDAVVIIQGLNLGRDEQSLVNNIESQNGSLKTILKDASSQEDSIVSATVGKGDMNTMSSAAGIDEKLENLVIAYQTNNGDSVDSEKMTNDTSVAQTAMQDANPFPLTTYGFGIIIGEPTAIGGKSWITRKQAIDLEIGWSFPGERIHIAADYLFHFPEWIQINGWNPFLGIGGRLKIKTKQADDQFRLGIRFGAGAEYIYRQFGLFAEFYPIVDIIPETVVGLECGIGARYYFKE